MTPDELRAFVRESAADEREHLRLSLDQLVDTGDRLIAQAAAGAVIDATSLLIREQERANPTTAGAAA